MSHCASQGYFPTFGQRHRKPGHDRKCAIRGLQGPRGPAGANKPPGPTGPTGLSSIFPVSIADGYFGGQTILPTGTDFLTLTTASTTLTNINAESDIQYEIVDAGLYWLSYTLVVSSGASEALAFDFTSEVFVGVNASGDRIVYNVASVDAADHYTVTAVQELELSAGDLVSIQVTNADITNTLIVSASSSYSLVRLK